MEVKRVIDNHIPNSGTSDTIDAHQLFFCFYWFD